MSSWAWEMTDRAGTTVSVVVPRRAVIQRNLNGVLTATLTMDAAQAQEALHGRLVRGWRTPNAGGARVLRSHTQINNVQAQAGADQIETVTATSVDAFGMMAQRILGISLVFEDNTPAEIIQGMLDYTNEFVMGVLGLYIDNTAASGPARDRSYEFNKNMAEIVTQLAEVDDGFWFKVDPYQGTRDGLALFSEFVFLYPNSGSILNHGFEFGPGTVANISSCDVTVLPPVNYVVAQGAGEAGAQIYSVQSDAPSLETYGANTVALSFTDVSEQATLDQHVLDALRPEPQRSYRIVPVEFGPNLPTPWEDFDIGDIVRLRLAGSSPYLSFTGQARVTSFTVEVDEDGAERLTDLVLESV